jgi:hypothetical protein
MFETPEDTIKRIVTHHTLDERRQAAALARLVRTRQLHEAVPSQRQAPEANERLMHRWPWRLWRTLMSS